MPAGDVIVKFSETGPPGAVVPEESTREDWARRTLPNVAANRAVSCSTGRVIGI